MYTTSARMIFSLMYKLQQQYGNFSIAGFLKPMLGVLDLFRCKPARKICGCLQEEQVFFVFFQCVHTYAHDGFFWYKISLTVNYRSETLIFFFFRVQKKKDEARCLFYIFCNSHYRVKLEERVVQVLFIVYLAISDVA